MGIFDHFSVQEDIRLRQEEMRRQYGSVQDELGKVPNDRLRQAIRQQAEAQNAKSPVQQPEPNPALLLLGEDE